APAAIGIEPRAHALDEALTVKPHIEASEKRMPFAREAHIQPAGETHTHRPARRPCAKRGHGSVRVGLRLLATERPAHPEAFHGDQMPRHPQSTRDNLLRFGRM